MRRKRTEMESKVCDNVSFGIGRTRLMSESRRGNGPNGSFVHEPESLSGAQVWPARLLVTVVFKN